MADLGYNRAPFAAWDRREAPGSFTVEETARRVGHYKWIEMKLFELTGAWLAAVPELEVSYRLGLHCYEHAFHAELWARRLPELREMNPQRLTVAPNAELEEFVEAIASSNESDHTIEKLVALYRVLLPQLIATYTFHRNNSATVSDAPTVRALELCLRDDMEQWREGEMLLLSLLDSPETIERAAGHQRVLAGLLLRSGGIAGPGSAGMWSATVR
jgi:hypothetical protein